jgi:hypothetical protein
MTLQFWTPDQLQHNLGLLIDQADNYLAYRDVPMPPALKVDAYHLGLQDLRNQLKALYFELGGEDVWDHP